MVFPCGLLKQQTTALRVEGDPVLDKIVIRTGQTESAAHLLALLSRIFPECEIQIVSNANTGEAARYQNEFPEEEHG